MFPVAKLKNITDHIIFLFIILVWHHNFSLRIDGLVW